MYFLYSCYNKIVAPCYPDGSRSVPGVSGVYNIFSMEYIIKIQL